MEVYAFAIQNGSEGILKIKDDHYHNLIPGFQRYTENRQSCIIIHSFIVENLIQMKRVGDIYYEWYAIREYSYKVDDVSPIADKTNKLSLSSNIAFVTLAENGTIDEITSGEHADAFPEYGYGIDYKQGQIRRSGENLFKCLQVHTSQEGWEPEVTPALWKKIGDPTTEWPEWSQPISAGDGYLKGDKVSHNGSHWISDYDGENVWEPGVFGWKQV